MPDTNAYTNILWAKKEIEEQLKLFARGADRNDIALMQSVFHKDAQIDYGIYRGSADKFAQWVAETHKTQFVATAHVLSNILIVVNGEHANSEAYLSGRLRYRIEEGFAEIISSGRYLGRWEQRSGSWRMVHHMAVMDNYKTETVRRDPAIAGWFDKLPQGSFDETDISYNYMQ